MAGSRSIKRSPASLPRVQQGPACQLHCHRGEQSTRPRARDRQGAAGPQERAKDQDQQREDRLSKNPRALYRPTYKAKTAAPAAVETTA